MVLTRNQKRNLDIAEITDDESHKKCKLDQFETDEYYKESSEESGNNISDEQNEEYNINNKLQEIIKESIKNVIQNFQNTNKYLDTETEAETETETDSSYNVNENDEYSKFNKYLNAIYEGDFFERHCVEDKKSAFRAAYSLDEIKKINCELEELQNLYKNDCPGVIDILKMNIDKKQKQQLLEKLYHYSNSEILSSEYVTNLKYLKSNLNSNLDDKLKKLEDEILKRSTSLEFSDNYREKILRSKMPFENKVVAYKRLDIMTSYEDSDSSEYAKHKNWMDTLLSIPFDENFSNLKDNNHDIKHIREVLDRRLSFLEKPKDQIINIVTQMMRNPEFTINAIGLYGVKGVGKTQIVKSISEALGRPYRSISLGGESDSSLLTGHNFTYVGSTPGRLIDILRETKCSNPIILFDELDKVSTTNHGKEIIGNLIHLTDKTTNNKYNYDRYFSGVNFDLSKVLFIFTYNDASKVDKILADRLFKIRVENYNFKEKLEITKVHLIKSILEEYNDLNVSIDEDAIHYIVSTSKNDEGMRDIKRKFEIVISRVNTLMLTNPDDDIVRLKYKSLHHYYRENNKILKDHIDVLLSDSFSSDTNVDNDPPFGMYI
jgi:hypothetical protein